MASSQEFQIQATVTEIAVTQLEGSDTKLSTLNKLVSVKAQ